MKSPPRIPGFITACTKVANGTASPLDQFVYECEPSQQDEMRRFRKCLAELLAWYGDKVNKEG